MAHTSNKEIKPCCLSSCPEPRKPDVLGCRHSFDWEWHSWILGTSVSHQKGRAVTSVVFLIVTSLVVIFLSCWCKRLPAWLFNRYSGVDRVLWVPTKARPEDFSRMYYQKHTVWADSLHCVGQVSFQVSLCCCELTRNMRCAGQQILNTNTRLEHHSFFFHC